MTMSIRYSQAINLSLVLERTEAVTLMLTCSSVSEDILVSVQTIHATRTMKYTPSCSQSVPILSSVKMIIE